VKNVASLEATDVFYRQLLGTIPKLWVIGLRGDEKEKAGQVGYAPIILIPAFLRGWIDDLKGAHPLSLPAYLGLLCILDDRHNDEFDQAVKAFVEHVHAALVKKKDVKLVGEIADFFVCSILNPRVDSDLKMAVKHTGTAVSLIDYTVRLHTVGAIRNAEQPALRAMRNLAVHVQSCLLSLPKQNKESQEDLRKLCATVYGNARETLQKLWDGMAVLPERSCMEEPYTALMALLHEPIPQVNSDSAESESTLPDQTIPEQVPSSEGVYIPARATVDYPLTITFDTPPKPGKSGPAKSEPGRPKEYDDDEDERLVRDWKASGTAAKYFCRDRGKTVKELRKACDRVRARRRTQP